MKTALLLSIGYFAGLFTIPAYYYAPYLLRLIPRKGSK